MCDGIKHVELHNASQGQHLSIDITTSSPVCDNSPKLKWVPSSNGQVPPGAVRGGHSETGETLYIARAIHDKTHTPGKVESDGMEMVNVNIGGLKSRSGGSDPHKKLLKAIQQKDIITFETLLKSETVDLNHWYGFPIYKTCLDIACSGHGYSRFVKLLLDRNVDVNKVNNSDQKAPIHYAIETGDLDTIKTLMEDYRTNVSAMSKGFTVIHLAIKHIEGITIGREQIIKQYEKIIKKLINSDSDVNIPDMKRITPIYSAAKQGLEGIVKLIIEESKKPVDLDSYIDSDKRSARIIIEEKFSHLKLKLPSTKDYNKSIDEHKLFFHLNGHDEDGFIGDFNKIEKTDLPKILLGNNGSTTLFQSICEKGFDKAADILLKNGADPNTMAEGSTSTPIELACSNGYSDVLKILLGEGMNTTYEPVENDETLIHIVVKKTKHLKAERRRDYKECLKILLEHPIIKGYINHLDIKGNTALHYAARSGYQDNVLTLLKHGACIGIRNTFNVIPLADISAKTLETYLDYCLTTENERYSDENYELRFDYSFLLPSSNIHNDETKIPKTDTLLYMAKSPELKPLLKHPVIESFLCLKWQQISCLFYVNVIVYGLLYLSLILCIHFGYSNGQYGTTAYHLSIFGLILLIIREILLIFLFLKAYFKSKENWWEIFFIFKYLIYIFIFTAVIVFNFWTNEHLKAQLSAIAILLSSAEFVLLIGQFPRLSTNIDMLKRVSWNFLKFISFYFIIIIAFSLSFYTLFKTVKTDDPNGEKVTSDAGADEKETKFFPFGIALFKTIVMLTGELDSGSINFGASPYYVSHIIFLIFVFMIPIVLFNLLNGLAISDIQAIKADVELAGLISRIKTVFYIESVILGDLNLYNNAYCWLLVSYFTRSRKMFIEPVTQFVVKIDRDRHIKVCTTDRQKKKNVQNFDDTQKALCCLSQCNRKKMDKKIVEAAKKLIADREEGGSEMKQLQNKLLSMEKSHENIKQLLEQLQVNKTS